MSQKTICITFPYGGIVPATILGEAKDRHVDAHEPIIVPYDYGRHLIHDRFAVSASIAPAVGKKPAAGKKGEKKTKADDEGAGGAIPSGLSSEGGSDDDPGDDDDAGGEE